jgi:mRNA-degrading endonuclease RelE of RelBE toxin-antitoxin system
MYALSITPAAQRELDRLHERIRPNEFSRLEAAIDNLAVKEPRNSLKVKGRKDTFRIRVGRYRVIYEKSDKTATISVLRVVRRSESTYDF